MFTTRGRSRVVKKKSRYIVKGKTRYIYGVMLETQAGTPVFFFKKKRKTGPRSQPPPGVLWHAEMEGYESQVRAEALRVLRSRDWSDVKPLRAPRRATNRTYHYGLKPGSEGRWESFYCLRGSPLPSKAEGVTEYVGTLHEVRQLAADQLGIGALVTAPVEPRPQAVVEPGAVVMHVDPEGQHLGIVLAPGRAGWLVLFFTSNARWGKRRATRDEVALAGFKMTKKATYLAGPLDRSDVGLIPTGLQFLPHRVEALIEEFGA